MKNNNYSFINAVIGVAGLIGIGYGLAMHQKVSKISDRLERSIDDLADNTEIDIPEILVNKAVEKAVSTETKRAVEKATNEALVEVRRDIRRDVDAAVSKEYESIKDSVLKEITVSASKIDVSRVRKDVEAAAKKAALDKFDVNLESILEKFNSDLDNTAKVYSTIKSMMTPSGTSTGREYVFRIG